MFDSTVKQVSDALLAIVNQNNAIRTLLAHAPLRGHLFDTDTCEPLQDTPPGQQLGFALSDISVPATNTGGTSNVTRYPGYFTCAPEIVDQIRVLNDFKEHFSNVAKTAKAIGFTWRDFRASYSAAGLATCHALQAGRSIHVVSGDVRGLGFTMARRIQSIRNMTMVEAVEWLTSVEAYDVVDILQERGYAYDTQVRLMRPVAAHPRVNVRHPDGNKQLNGSMPIIVDKLDWSGEVKFNAPGAQPPKERSDSKKSVDTIHLPFMREGQLQVFCNQLSA